jgi:3-methyladenine DNA glycosylase AlkC
MEPFKNAFNRGLVADMGRHLAAVGPFDEGRFIALACDGLEALELKARSRHIAAALDACLPDDFAVACAQMVAALGPETETEGWEQSGPEEGIRGWAMMPMGEVIQTRGAGSFDLAMETLAGFTSRFSSEFDVRPFLDADLERGLTHLHRWAEAPNPHLRRLASEGCRPRLPWGMQLKGLIADPAPILPLPARLRDDPSEYVRRSVANNLNDIAKDHPDLVAGIAQDWLTGASKDRARLVRHACRTLIKAGHPGALEAFGYGPPALDMSFSVHPETARMGDDVALRATLRSRSKTTQTLVVDYVVHFMRANGKPSPKVFKWTQAELAPGAEITLSKAHKLREVTTRKHYPGVHEVVIQVNGQRLGADRFTLVPNGD